MVSTPCSWVQGPCPEAPSGDIETPDSQLMDWTLGLPKPSPALLVPSSQQPQSLSVTVFCSDSGELGLPRGRGPGTASLGTEEAEVRSQGQGAGPLLGSL